MPAKAKQTMNGAFDRGIDILYFLGYKDSMLDSGATNIINGQMI